MLTVKDQTGHPDTPAAGTLRLYSYLKRVWSKNEDGDTQPIGVPHLPGYIYGLEMSNNVSDATNDIDIATGLAAASDVADYIELTSALTKRLDAAWAVGSGNGGLDTGSIANTTYHVWLIKRSDTGVVDALFSTSATSPTMPANYDQKRRIGAILRESGAIVGFVQHGDRFMRKATTTDQIAGSLPTGSRTLGAVLVPTGIKVVALLRAYLLANSANNVVMLITDPDQTDSAASAGGTAYSVWSGDAAGWYHAGQIECSTNTSAQVGYRGSHAQTFGLSAYGWIDSRGGALAQSSSPAATNITEGSSQATTSGTTKDWTIPAGAKRVTINLQGVSTSGANRLLVQIGDSGGVETTGYVAGTSQLSSGITTTTSTAGFINSFASAGDVRHGQIILSRLEAATNTWCCQGQITDGGATTSVMSGSKSLSGELTTVRLTTVGGTDTFDAGLANVSWEF